MTFSPALAYQNERFFGPTEIKLGIAAIFASDELMSYFYEVEPRFATATRRAFSPDAGYLGTQVELLVKPPAVFASPRVPGRSPVVAPWGNKR